MAFQALRDSEIVWPDEVETDEIVQCPNCGEHLSRVVGHPRDGTWVSSHFRHETDVDCAGGETDTHKLMKYVASRACKQEFDPASLVREGSVEETSRTADVLARFDESHPVLGRGIAIEVQYKHEDKDTPAVSREYLDAGFSVIWADESDFSADFRAVSLEKITPVWPYGVPPSEEWRARPVGTQWREDIEPAVYSLEATLPPAWVAEIRGELKRRWQVGSGELDSEVSQKLSSMNATRRCGLCGDNADYYLYEPGVIQGFRCEAHHPANMDQECL